MTFVGRNQLFLTAKNTGFFPFFFVSVLATDTNFYHVGYSYKKKQAKVS